MECALQSCTARGASCMPAVLHCGYVARCANTASITLPRAYRCTFCGRHFPPYTSPQSTAQCYLKRHCPFFNAQHALLCLSLPLPLFLFLSLSRSVSVPVSVARALGTMPYGEVRASTLRTQDACPVTVPTWKPSLASNIFTVPSSDAANNNWERGSGENDKDLV